MGRSHWARWTWSVAATVAAACTATVMGQTPSLTLIAPPAGRSQTFVSALSMDGRTVTGYTRDENFVERGFTWTRGAGMDEWGARVGIPVSTNPTGISSDGSTIVGRRLDSSTNSYTAFRYSNGTYQTLGASPPGFGANSAFGVSGDSSVIVGSISQNGAFSTAMRWTAGTGMQSMGVANGGLAGWFTGISRDGSTAIGISTGSASGFDAYTWTQSGGWRMLPVPGGIGTQYDARPQFVSSNGTLVVGYASRVSDPSIAILWQNGVPTNLGNFGPRWDMFAGGISDDGRVIAGSGTDRDTGRSSPVIWLEGSGPINFEEYMRSLGYALPPGWVMRGIGDISSDGRTILGLAQNGSFYQGFVATIPCPGSIACMTCIALFASKRRRALL